MVRSVLRGMTAFFVVVVLTPITCVAVVLAALIFLPLPATLPQPKAVLDSQATHVVDANGNEIAVFKQFETSIPVQQTDIPQVLKDAVVASEDRGFYEHGGVDPRGTLRALWQDVTNSKVLEGGSTITQQYVKQAFTGGERTLARKIREAILAGQLDRQVDKDTILFQYLSASYFGEGAYGVGAAAQTYFRKPVSQLTLSEAALLAGVLPAPTAYSPRTHADVAEQRRVHVLDVMLEIGRIDQATHDAAVAQPVWLLAFGEPGTPVTGVFPAEVAQSSQPWFANYVHAWLETHLPGCVAGSCPVIEQGGLRVVTTLDPAQQAAAEDEVAKTMGDNDLNIQMALVAVEPPTGYIRSMVGGRDFAYNQTNTATTGHQPGSSFKPFVLAEAFAQGIQPTAVYSGAPLVLPDVTINNYGHEAFGSLSLRQATWHSVNGVYARLIQDVGVEETEAMADRLGANLAPYDPVNDGVSVALGTKDVAPLSMASAFGVFADHGKRAEPTPVLQVFDSSGKLLIDNTKAADVAAQVIDPVVADNVTDVLRGVLESGTAAGKGINRPAAGKTGTASDAANAWFVGYTPTLSTAVWMGHLDCGASTAERDCGLSGINGVREVTGGTIPASTWQRFMNRALASVPATEFTEPAPIQSYADEAKRASRGGFDPGPRQYPSGTGDGSYVDDVPVPDAVAPTTSTTSTTTTTSTTLAPPTTRPPLIN
ncbi:MAG: transglycosylase domain-containing protein [Acidimicrobiales bacterium]